MGNVKIVSDGTPLGTKVFDAETGVEIPGNITGIDWSAHLENDENGHKKFRCFATIVYLDPELDVQVDKDDLSEAGIPLESGLGDND